MATLVPTFDLAKTTGDNVEIDAATVEDLILEAIKRWGEPFKETLSSASILVNGRNIHYLQGRRTPLSADDVVWLVRAASGG